MHQQFWIKIPLWIIWTNYRQINLGLAQEDSLYQWVRYLDSLSSSARYRQLK